MDQKELNWPEGSKILVVLAHPDDPEFFMGGTIASWCKAGYRVKYALLTNGERGVSEAYPDGQILIGIRRIEQKKAAAKLGVYDDIYYFGYSDGFLQEDLEVRKRVVALIRAEKPDIVVSSDPTMLFSHGRYLNHPDHRMAGQITMNALFPAVGNRSFYPELLEQGLEPWQVKEFWLSLTNEPDVILDLDEYWQTRYEALCQHVSQIKSPEKLLEHLKARRSGGKPYQESFRRIVFGG